jgi:hypothetical protein
MASTTSVRRPWTGWLLQRWPTALAIALAALALAGGDSQQDQVTSLSQALLVLPLEYLIVAKFRTQRATWPVIAVLLPATLVLLETEVVDPTVLLSGLALVVLAWSAVDGQLRRSGVFQVQALGMVGLVRWRWSGWRWIRSWAAGWWRRAGWRTASGTSSTSGSTRWWPAPTPSGAASSTS